MAITFTPTVPTSATAMGPGYGFTVKSLFTPVAGHTYDVNVQLIRLPTLVTVCMIDNTNYTMGTNWDAIFGCKRNATDVISLVGGGGVVGDDCEVRVETVDVQLGQVVDGPQTFQSFFYDPVCQQYICTLFSGGSGSSGGFNQGDRDQLTAIHNATVRAGYSTTATHVGLVDNGSITTLNLTRALRVTVTQFPPNVDRAQGTPQYFFDLGFFTMNVAQGWVKSQRLVFEFQMYEAPQALDSFGWTLTPGTTINVEELTPT